MLLLDEPTDNLDLASAEALDRMNRSFEYDGLGDNYARFLLGRVERTLEVVPLELLQLHAPPLGWLP